LLIAVGSLTVLSLLICRSIFKYPYFVGLNFVSRLTKDIGLKDSKKP